MTHHDDQQSNPSDDAFDQMLADANRAIMPPSGLEQRVSRKIGRSIAIRRIATASSVAVVAIIAGVLIQTMMPASQIQPGSLRANGNGVVSPSAVDLSQTVPVIHRAAIVHTKPESEFFGRAIPTSKPNVTIVRLYRDLTPTRHTTPEPETANEEIHDENTENQDQNTDPANQPGAAGPGATPNETTIRSEA